MNRKFKIWIIEEGEPIPQVTGIGKNMRSGIMSKCFSSDSRNDVTWFTSTFLHYEKRHIFHSNKSCIIDDNFKIEMIHSPIAYKKNISIVRIFYCKILSIKFAKKIKKENKPDLIICGWPLIELAYESIKYGIKNNVPVIIDIRDFWPDIFYEHFYGLKRKLFYALTKLFFSRKTKYVMKNAFSVIGVVPNILSFSRKYGRLHNANDKVVFLSALRDEKYSEIQIFESKKFWEDLKFNKEKFIVSYVGSLESIFDYDLISRCLKSYNNENVLFVICGNGKYLNLLHNDFSNRNDIIIPGYLNSCQINYLLSNSDVGMIPYRNTFDFVDAIPTKFGEYLSYGLPIISSLRGISKQILQKYECGNFFDNEKMFGSIINGYLYNKKMDKIQKTNSLCLFNEKFNAKKVYNEYLNEIKKVI